MTYYPQQPQYPSYHPNYSTLPTNPRPTSVTVLAVIGIIWAVLVLLCNVIGVLPFVTGFANQVADEIRANPPLLTWTIIGTVLRVLAALALLAGSIAALRLRNWGRQLMIAYAVVAILAAFVELGFWVKYQMPKLEQQAVGKPPGFVAGQRVGFVVGFAAVSVYPVLVLILMNKANLRAAFAGGGTTSAALGPQRTYPYGGQRPY
jgi:hypothetical protein